MELLDSYEIEINALLEFAKKIAEIAKDNGMKIGSCAESIDLDECGIEHNCCIDKTLIFATNERMTFNDIQRQHGPVLKLVDIAESYIKSNIHWRVEFTGALQRKEIPEIPIRRNPKIARILYYSKDIESFGTGLKRIADACEKASVRYEFKKLKSGFVVCFYRSEKSEDNSTDITVKNTDKVRINTDKLNLSQKKIVDFILENGKITNKEVQQLLAVKDSRALKVLKELVEMDIILKKGKLKGSYYTLKNMSKKEI